MRKCKTKTKNILKRKKGYGGTLLSAQFSFLDVLGYSLVSQGWCEGWLVAGLLKPWVVEKKLCRHPSGWVIGQQGADNRAAKSRHVLWDGIVTGADFGEKGLRIGVKKRVVAHEECVENNSETP